MGQNNVNVNVNVGGPIIVQAHGPNMLVRVIYFVFVGWWLGGIVSTIAWLLNVTVIGLPLGLYLINRLPSIITLRPQEQAWRLEGNVLTRGQRQRPFLWRAMYFVFVGWWFSGVWVAVAYLCLVVVVLIPLSFWMYGRVGAVTTLYRS